MKIYFFIRNTSLNQHIIINIIIIIDIIHCYINILEAIFESSPQILISTVYLIKINSNTNISFIVLSLLTSFYTLTSRVSMDDKSMILYI